MNRRLLFQTLAALAVILPATYLWHRHQVRQAASGLLSRAEQLERDEDWLQATSYYQRYLLLEPQDTRALVKMADAFAELEPSPDRLSRLNTLLYQAVGRAPDRTDLQLKLAENLLQLGAFEEAAEKADKLLDKSPEEARRARKVIALSLSARASVDGDVTIASAANALIAAAAESPADVQLIEVAANSLRENPAAVEVEGADAATLADRMFDQLVAADPHNVEALIARYRYRVQYKLPDANPDLQAALKIDPKNVDALLMMASAEQASLSTDEQRSQTESLLRRAIDVAPADPRPYLALARVLEQSGQRAAALDLLELGRTATDDNFPLVLALANTQVNAEKLEAAEQTLETLEVQSATFLVRLNGPARNQAENQLRLLRARLGIARGDSRAAAPLLQSILLATEASAVDQPSLEWVEASRLLGQIYARAGQWDRASQVIGSLAKRFPGNAAVASAAADAYLKAGDPDNAIEALDDFARLASPSGDLLVLRVRAHLARQLSRPDADRNWSEFEQALAAAKSGAANRLELVFAEVNYLVAKGDKPAIAADALRAAESQFAEQPAFWRSAAEAYQQLGQAADLQRALEKHRKLAASAADHAELRAALLVNEGKYADADKLLADLGPTLDPEARRRLERRRVDVLTASNNFAGAIKLLKQLIDANPEDAEVLAVGADVALAAGDVPTAESWESKLRDVTHNGFEARYLRARRLLLSYDQLSPQAKQELGESIQELRAARPRWYPAVAQAAQLAELQGDAQQALANYELAVELGDRRPLTLQHVAELLFKDGRFDEAQAYLSRLSGDPASGPFRDSLALELAVKQDRSAAALDLARRSVERFPDDVMRRLVWANLLLKYGKPQEAVEVLQQATKKFADDSRAWTGLFAAFVQAGQTDEARRTLTALVTGSVLPPERRHFVAAQGYEILGDADEARQQYGLAIEQRPEDSAIRLKFAKLIADSDPGAARDQYEHVLQKEPANKEAQRQLAVLLAATGQKDDWAQATQLLDAATDVSSSGDAITSDRLRAMLLSRKGRTRAERIANCQEARRILQPLVDAGAAQENEVDRLLMVQILEQEADLGGDQALLIAARDSLRSVVDQGPPTVERLALYIDFLLRHAQAPAPEDEDADKSATAAANLAAARRHDVFLDDADAKLEDLRRLTADGDDGQQALTAALSARLFKARGRDAEAADNVADFVARVTGKKPAQGDQAKVEQARRSLMIGRLYASLGAHAEAESWYRRLMALNPAAYVLVVQELVEQGKREAAAELCLSSSTGTLPPEAATLLANVMTAATEPIADLPAVQAALEAAVREHGDNIGLLQAEAVRRASRGQYDDAIAIFRRILAIDPRNTLALNNLATLLAEKPNQRAEALQLIEQAIAIAGRQASLLDTQGTIYLKIGDAAQAIACLEESTAGGTADARYYLHLAAAYHLAHNDNEARRMLEEARGFGLEKFVLTDDDRKLVTMLDGELKPLGPAAGTP